MQASRAQVSRVHVNRLPARRLVASPARLRRDERGEGVISAAIAVLVMAFIGVGMWIAFNTMFQHTATKIDHQVNDCIGQTTTGC